MAEATDDTGDVQKKSSKKPLLIGLVLAILMGGGGFFVTSSGMLSAPSGTPEEKEVQKELKELANIEFVRIEPVLIALARETEKRHLRFRGNLEVESEYREDVEALMPRILDVLNSYLRAVEIKQLEDPAALLRLRAQMLRRVQIVTGDGRVRDLLISEFVVN